jgi:hypothetical protein
MERKFMKRVLCQSLILGVAMLCSVRVIAGEKKAHPTSKLQVVVNDAGQMVLTWNGKEELAEARARDGKFKRIHKSASPYIVTATEDGATYRLEADNCNCYSVNAVGYANLQLPPGLSLIANPLYYTNNDLSFWMPNPPDGSQVYKYTASGGYEVSTFDGISGQWSNPTLQVEIGTGFFFRNTSQSTLTFTFVGEVPQGWLTNSLPQGYSTKGSLVPASQSLSWHQVPGEIGDEIRTYTNDLQGGGSYNISVYTDVGWTPDLTLGLGQGFWIYKRNAQDWVRYFTVN